MSILAIHRLMSALIPEEELVNDSIKELIKYRDAKFNASYISNEPKEASFEGLKEFFKGNTQKKVESNIQEPIACISALFAKWCDKNKSMEDIVSESTKFENGVDKTNLKDKEK